MDFSIPSGWLWDSRFAILWPSGAVLLPSGAVPKVSGWPWDIRMSTGQLLPKAIWTPLGWQAVVHGISADGFGSQQAYPTYYSTTVLYFVMTPCSNKLLGINPLETATNNTGQKYNGPE